MKDTFSKIYFLILFSLTLSGCNESQVEVTPIDENLVFMKKLAGASLIENISLLDGSEDNILDNASCFQLQLPVNVLINDELTPIQSKDDIEEILSEFLKNPFVEFKVVFQFPVTVESIDHSMIDIENQSELDSLRNTCIENGDDLDIECIDFQYPISIATYDRLNQLADVSLLNSDADLYFLLGSFSDEDLFGFEFPINMVNADGLETTISDNTNLFELINTNLNSCDENDRLYQTETPPPTQTLLLKLTDAPFPLDLVEEVNVNLTKIDIKTGPENNSVEYITLFEEDITVDMLTLTNGNTLDLSMSEIPVGSYPSLRMFVNDGFVLMKDGQVFELKVPSGSQSGIKINLREDLIIDENQSREVLLDFDVSKSLVARGNINSPNGINGFNFKPVINASVLSQSGSLRGTVIDNDTETILENAQVSIIAADTTFTTSFTNSEGNFRVLGIPSGSFSVLVELKDFLPETVQPVVIAIEEETDISIRLIRE